jgi:hypothetical protein
LVLNIKSTLLVLALAVYAQAGSVEFELLTHPNNVDLLPQQKGWVGISGDYLLHTDDDIWGSIYNPNGCFSFNFMNPVGIWEPDYPPGYAEGIHSMTGTLTLQIDLYSGGTVEITSLAFDGDITPEKPIAHQRLVVPGDPATGHNTDGLPNSGTYSPSADANAALEIDFDWYYDTPFAGTGGIDMTFDNYHWSGFIIPVSRLTPAGMAATTLDDPLGYFGGTSEDFETWLLCEVATRLPQQATYLLFVQGEAHPSWTNPDMGMTTDGIVGETIIGYAVTAPGPDSADIDWDGDVDLFDYAILAGQWRQVPGEPSADIAPFPTDGFVDINDLAFIAQNWLWGITEPNEP